MAVVVVLVVLLGGHHNKNSPPTTAASSASSTTSSNSGASNSGGGGAGATTPFLGVSVTSAGQPVTHPNGTQVIITDASGKSIALTGVKVLSVQSSVSVGGKANATPASIIPLKPGDLIWGIGEINASSYTQVTSGAVLTTFMKNYAESGHTDHVYLYFYDPSSNQNYDTNPPQIAFVETTKSIATLDCTSSAGC